MCSLPFSPIHFCVSDPEKPVRMGNVARATVACEVATQPCAVASLGVLEAPVVYKPTVVA